MNSLGYILNFAFLILCISIVWGILSFDARHENISDAFKSGVYIFSGLTGISLILIILISLLTA